MTNDELRIVQDVLRDSARLSIADADALTIEIARRCEARRQPSATKDGPCTTK
jgi:ribosomal protein L40E